MTFMNKYKLLFKFINYFILTLILLFSIEIILFFVNIIIKIEKYFIKYYLIYKI